MLDETKMFFIITGNYKVQSVMFDMKNKKAEIDAAAGIKVEKNPSKKLHKGDFFGELAILFGCKRTSTVKAMQYSQCAHISSKDF